MNKTYLSVCVCVCVCTIFDTHHYSLQDFCSDRGQDPLIIVLSNACEDPWELASHRPEQDTQCDVYILQICVVDG